MIPPDGLHGHDDYPPGTPVLAPAPKPSYTPPGDAMDRETWLRVARPMLIAAGHLRPEDIEGEPRPKTQKPKAAAKAPPPEPEPPTDDAVPF